MVEILLIAAFLVIFAIGGTFLQTKLFVHALERALSAQRDDSLKVLLAQSDNHEIALKAVQGAQSVGGTPLQLAIAQHEGQLEVHRRVLEQNHELAKNGTPVPKRPAATTDRISAAFGS